MWYDTGMSLTDVVRMKRIPANKARAKLYPLMGTIAKSGPVEIVGKHVSSVLIDAREWDSMMETIFIMSNSKIMKDIRAGLKCKPSDCKPWREVFNALER